MDKKQQAAAELESLKAAIAGVDAAASGASSEQAPTVIPIVTMKPGDVQDKPAIPTPVAAVVGAVVCPNCANTLFDTSNRIELNGAIRLVKFDSITKQKSINTIAANVACCNVHCLSAYVNRL